MGGSGPAPQGQYSAEAQELRALLRRVPDGFQAALTALRTRPDPLRERVMVELVRGMGKDILPLVRAAALDTDHGLALTAVRVLPVFGTRAAGDVLAAAFAAKGEREFRQRIWAGAQALQARGVRVSIPEPEPESVAPRLVLRETWCSAPDRAGGRSVAARLQDQYGVWHALFVLWDDEAGIRDSVMRPFSRQEWDERLRPKDPRDSSHTLCPADYARWQVAEARAISSRPGQPVDEKLAAWDAHVGPPTPGYEPPDPAPELAAAPEERDRRLRESPELLELPELRRWMLDPSDWSERAQAWIDLENQMRLRGESGESGESGRLQQERAVLVAEVTAGAIDAVLAEKLRGRLLDVARFYRIKRQNENALRAAAAASATVPADQNPLFTALVERSLALVARYLQQGGDPARLRSTRR